ncbi:DUF488 domain-containing protein [Actinoplanes sp. NPDC049316]|uniref:DUF488 domain-containing protein n=1 Tax=Actinoplanes sp. NPDC049316 TaxID=3154727 RepID=UPI003420417C
MSRLVDVRLNPISRKPSLTKTALGRTLAEAGIVHEHRRELGNPKADRAGFAGGVHDASGWWVHGLQHKVTHTLTVAAGCDAAATAHNSRRSRMTTATATSATVEASVTPTAGR